MGKRQRHSQFIGVPLEEVERIAHDMRQPKAERLKAVAELKFHKKRNRQKRAK